MSKLPQTRELPTEAELAQLADLAHDHEPAALAALAMMEGEGA